MPSSRTVPAVVVAGALSAVLWVVTGRLADWLSGAAHTLPGSLVRTLLPHPTGPVAGGEPVSGSTLLAAALAGALVALGTHVALRRLPSGTGRWATFLAVWFSTVAASALAATAVWFAGVTLPWRADTITELVATALGGWWGLVNGLLVGLAVVVTRALLDRRDDPAGTRHTRGPRTVRAWPAALVAGAATAVLWAAAGIGRTTLPGSADPQSPWGVARDVVLLPSARLAVDRDALLADPVHLALPLAVGLTVALLTALAARRLPPVEGTGALLLATWCACVLGAALAAAVPVVVSTLDAGGALPDVGRTLPVLQAGLAWGLVCGVLVAPLAVVVHRAAGTVRHDDGEVEEPWPAPTAADDTREPAPTEEPPTDEPAPAAADAPRDDAPREDARERTEVPANA
ncbi:hypothetical protein [Cellulosimicrobium protaetiae]|uniref:Uncharacterized protein n=1 Tax=Cellulosimicrobium protaetiae TaxID=2587808 RepID=A0A6M5UBK2_9MICO|nr:hypothetical protein [Cellulosimicrobium protaetiae]QJW35464.1 hypothetical protein FIC82_003850 [Cellulosimicrobium protaetiae]